MHPTTFNEACKKYNLPDNWSPKVDDLPEFMRAYTVVQKRLELVVAAINDGWVADWSNTSQKRYYIWWNIIGGGVAGRGLSFDAVGYVFTHSCVAACLVFETEEKARHAAKYFKALFEEYYFTVGFPALKAEMKMVTAVFIGKDDQSVGYKNGETYTLKTQTRPSEIFPDKRSVICFQRLDATGYMECESFEKDVCANWKYITSSE